jgi:hypothetical protein
MQFLDLLSVNLHMHGQMSQLGQKRYKLSNKLFVGIEILRLDSCKAFSSLPFSLNKTFP